MLNIIQNNINKTTQTIGCIVWNKITNGIELNNKELVYLKKYKIKNIDKYELINNGCILIDMNEHKFWYKNGKLHREDGAAIEYSSGDKVYYNNGKKHRKDGPAIEFLDGYKAYYINGKRHREDGPAIEFENGHKEYFINGLLHREKWTSN